MLDKTTAANHISQVTYIAKFQANIDQSFFALATTIQYV